MCLHEQLTDCLSPGILLSGILEQPILLWPGEHAHFQQFDAQSFVPLADRGDLVQEFLDGGEANFLQAEARYRDFQNRFPTSDRAAYVQLQIARSLVERMERPDRDQKVTRQAREAIEELLRTYPSSPEAERAQPDLARVLDHLAEHEHSVGSFYLRFGLALSAVPRFETVLRQYPDYSRMDQLLFELSTAQRKIKKVAEADQTLARLREEFPQSPWTRKAEKQKG